MKIILDELKAVRGSVIDLQTALTSRIDTLESSISKRFGELEATSRIDQRWPQQQHLPATRPSARMGTASNSATGV